MSNTTGRSNEFYTLCFLTSVFQEYIHASHSWMHQASTCIPQGQTICFFHTAKISKQQIYWIRCVDPGPWIVCVDLGFNIVVRRLRNGILFKRLYLRAVNFFLVYQEKCHFNLNWIILLTYPFANFDTDNAIWKRLLVLISFKKLWDKGQLQIRHNLGFA